MQLYKLDFPNGKSYIGITSKTTQERFKSHCHPSNRKNPCQHAIQKYSKENIKIKVLAECDNWELLCLAEIEAIEKFTTKSPNGYNLTDGGDGCLGSYHSEFMKSYMNKPENREKNSIKSKLRFSTDSARNEAAQKTKDYFKNNPEMKEHLSKKTKEWAINNPEKEAERQAKATKTRTSLEKRTEMQAIKLLAANEQMKIKLILLPESERAKAEHKMLKQREYNARKREKRNGIKFT
jgi:hypothetical protein